LGFIFSFFSSACFKGTSVLIVFLISILPPPAPSLPSYLYKKQEEGKDLCRFFFVSKNIKKKKEEGDLVLDFFCLKNKKKKGIPEPSYKLD
jgi:hypothetical protein